MVVLDSVYVNNGGGLRLLQLLLARLQGCADIVVLLDSRWEVGLPGFRVVKIKAAESARRRFYREHQAELQKVFCFGNVPPPVRLNCPVVTYLHNRLLLNPPSVADAGLTGFKWWLKRFYLRRRVRNTDQFAVQTESMAQNLAMSLSVPRSKVKFWPFYEAGLYSDLAVNAESRGPVFGYVSLPHPHKGHAALLQAWELLAQAGIRPELHLTIPSDHPLAARVAALKSAGVCLVNHGMCNPREIYSICRYQIYPSETESFGLGLIEATEAGCLILAPDLPYVHAVVTPSCTWIPNGGAAAIAQCVRACLATTPVSPRLVTENKLDQIIGFLTAPE